MIGLGLGLSARSRIAGGADETQPALESAVDAANGPTAATGSVDTDLGNGTLYVVALLTADSTPSAAQVKAGLKADGTTPAPFSGSQAVSGTGTQTLAGSAKPTLLAPETGYKLAYMHESNVGVQSDVLVADGFTTTAVVVGDMDAGGGSITNPSAATGSIAVAVGDLIIALSCEQTSTGTVTGATDNLSNTYTAQNAGSPSGTSYGRAFYSIATNAGTLETVNFAATGSTNDYALKVAVFKGPFSEIDANPANKADGTSPFTATESGTLAQASELVIGWLGGTSASDTITASSPWVLVGAVSSGGLRRAAIEYQNVSATTTLTPSFAGTNANCILGTMSFKRAA